MWWEFHRQMDLTPEQLVDEDDPIGLLEPVGPVDEEKKGKQTWRYAFPAQDYDLGRGEVYDPANKQARPNDSPFNWVVGDGAVVDAANRTVDFRRTVSEPHPRAIVPLNWVRTKDHQAALFELGEWVADHGIEATGPNRAGARPAARPAAAGRPVARRGALPRRRDPTSRPPAGSPLALDHTTLAIQGPPGSGKTYTGARMICSLLDAGQAGRDHRHEPQGHRQPADGGLRGRRDSEGVDVRPVQKGETDQVLVDDRVVARQGRRRCPGPPRRRPRQPRRRHVVALGVGEDDRGRRRPVRRRGRPDLAGQRRRDVAGDRQPRPARRPAAARPAAARAPIRRAPTAPRWRTSSATTPRCRRRRGLFLETTWRLHPDLCRFTSEVFYDDRLEPEAHLAVQRVAAGTTSPTAPGPRLLDVPTIGADNESPDRGRCGRGRSRGRSSRAAASWVDEDGQERAGRLGRRPDRRAVQRPGRRDQAAPAGRGAGRDRRQVPGPGGADQHLLDDDLVAGARAARHGLPVQPPPAQRRDVAGPLRQRRRRVAGPLPRAGRTPEQMRLANAFCRFAEMAELERRRTEAVSSRRPTPGGPMRPARARRPRPRRAGRARRRCGRPGRRPGRR